MDKKMREKIDLTVIIPNHNKEKYIVKCIESVLQQTILPKKIIIIDILQVFGHYSF